MQRTSRKRKPTEKVLNNPELEHKKIKSEIFLKPESQLGSQSTICYLCKVSSGVKVALQPDQNNATKKSSDPNTVDKIRACVGLEILPEISHDSRICRPCIRQLDGHYQFRKQALHCNDYAQNQMAEDEAEVVGFQTEILVCRFCLKIGGKLKNLHPPTDEDSEDTMQLRKQIADTLGVEINAGDAVTKICRSCIQKIQDLSDFRQQYLPVSVFVKQETDISLYEMEESIKEEDASQFNNNLDLELSVSDSDFSIDEACQDDPLTGGKIQAAKKRQKILTTIMTDDNDRNFSSENEIVIFNDYRYRFFSILESEESLWVCVDKRLRGCSARMIIDASCTRASDVKNNYHTHSQGPAKLMECPVGKGFIKYCDKKEPFWLFYGENSSSNITRSIIFQNYRFFLHQIRKNGLFSVWYCGMRGVDRCKAILKVYGIFKQAEILKEHNHKPVNQKKIDNLLDKVGIHTNSTEAIDEFQKDTSIEDMVDSKRNLTKELSNAIKSVTKEKNPEIFTVLSVADPERQFECVSAGPKMKIKYNDFEYRYFGKQADGSTLWKCVMDSLLHCALIVRVDESGKRLTIFKGSKHSHGKEPVQLFSYPLGQRMIAGEPLWLLPRYSMYYESRCVIYRSNVYLTSDINRKGVVRWNCLRKQSCRAQLIVKGNFETISLRKEHTHENTPEEILTKLKEGRSLSSEVGVDLTFKQKLLSYPSSLGKIWNESSHQYEPFYIIKTLKTGETVSCGLLFHNFRYVLTSVDQNGTSTWLCTKQTSEKVCCRGKVIVEGLYESICSKKEHIHNALLASEIEHMIKRSFNESSLDNDFTRLSEPKSISKNVLSLLARPDLDRNFEVTRIKTKLMIRYENEEFRLKSREVEGSSLWSCIWIKMRSCPVVLKLDAEAKHISPINATKTHNHTKEQIAVFHLQCGKGSIYDANRHGYSSYWLFAFSGNYRESRGIIYHGHKYTLHIIRKNQISCWKCSVRDCKATINIQGAFQTLFLKNKHAHDCLSHDDILAITKLPEIDKDLLENADTSEIPVEPIEHVGPLRTCDLLSILSVEDTDRNFNVIIHKDQMKIYQHRYEYYYRESTDTHTIWKCVYFTLRRCRASIHLSNDCKTATLPNVPKHNHKVELWEVFYYPLGKHSIMNAYTETVQPFWFLMQPGFLRPHPMLIYDDNKFTLASITENGDSSRWRCVANICRAQLTVTGLFDLIVPSGNPHNHESLSKQKQEQWIRLYGTPGTGGADGADDGIPFVKVEMEDCEAMEYEEVE